MYSLIIFDWDGTLMDSTERIVTCLAQAAVKSKLPVLEPKAYQQIIGLGLREAIRDLYPAIDEAQLESMRDHYSHFFILAEQTPNPLFPGALEVLNNLRSKGVKTAVATGKSRAGLDRVWANTGLGEFFDASRCADETESKPSPLMLNEILVETRVPVERALMVGDTSFDLEMAERIGMDRVGVSYGAHSAEVLAQYQPKAIIKKMPELLPLVLAKSLAYS